MSWKATAHVKELTHAPNGEPLTRSEKLLLLIIADYYNDEKKCAWASVPTLAENALLSDRRVQQLSRTAEMKGALRVTHRNGRSNVYRLPTLDRESRGEIISPLKSPSPGGEILTQGVKPASPPGVKHASPKRINRTVKIEPQENPPTPGVFSKHDLEICRQFARWLYDTRQGINNPEGFARDCWMTGLADKRIDDFLRDEVARPPEPTLANLCPECQESVTQPCSDNPAICPFVRELIKVEKKGSALDFQSFDSAFPIT